jgi:septal ring factor EnvC (AmiA/AmiB activator)
MSHTSKTVMRPILASFLALCCTLNVNAVYAQPKPENPSSQALKKAQGVVRQLTEEKTVLETEKTALQEQVKKLEGLVKQLEPLPGEVRRYQTAAETLRTGNSTLAAQLAHAQQKQQELHRKLQEVVAQAKLIQTDNQLLVSAVKERGQWISRCADKNRGLVTANGELVGKYKDKGFWGKLGELEPFTGIANVEIQNTVESYQFKLDDLAVTAFDGKGGQ